MVGDPTDVDHLRRLRLRRAATSIPSRRWPTWSSRPPRSTTCGPARRWSRSTATCPRTARYGCCNAHGSVSTLLEYDSEDFALAQFAQGTRRHRRRRDAAAAGQQLGERLRPAQRPADPAATRTGSSCPASPRPRGRRADYVEGDAYEYLWDVPNDYQALFSLLGGNSKVVPELQSVPVRAERLRHVRAARQRVRLRRAVRPRLRRRSGRAPSRRSITSRTACTCPGPSGLRQQRRSRGEQLRRTSGRCSACTRRTPGTDTLVLASPGFPHVTITLPNGKKITITAPGASQAEYYVELAEASTASPTASCR